MKSIDQLYKFNNNDKIVIGCSTGPDSMALVDMLLKIRDKYNLSLIICHVNHNVRKESYDEAEFIKKYCEDNHIIFESMVIEAYGDDNFHNEARNIRYHFFEAIVKKYEANYLMTAHHGDDLMETVLMRIVRGSNINGYGGFKSVVDMDGYKILRPLIIYTKQELLDYDTENNVPYFIDKSNLKDTYTRNRYRKYILPFLKSEDKDVHMKFLKFSNTLNEASRFIKKITKNSINKCIINDRIKIDSFLLEDEFIQKEILYYYIKDFYQDDLMLIGDKHIDLLLKLIKGNKTNGFINLPNDVIAKRNYNEFYICRNIDVITGYEILFDNYVKLPNNHSITLVDSIDNNSNFMTRLDSSELTMPLIVRTRRMGDKISVKGLNGNKKVKDIFIEKKIPLEERDILPVVVDSKGVVVWLPGIKKSKFDKKASEKYDIILKYN